MVKVSLQIKATLENMEELYTNHPDYSFLLKVKCSNCGEVSEKWHDVIESITVPAKTGRTEHHFVKKCKVCARENAIDIVPGSNGKYKSDKDKFQTIVTFDCRGIEPVEFSPGEGWIAKVKDSSRVFQNIDLSDKEWADYDESIKAAVGVYDFESQFVTVK